MFYLTLLHSSYLHFSSLEIYYSEYTVQFRSVLQTVHAKLALFSPSLLFTILMMFHVLLTRVMIITMMLQVLLVLSLLSAVSAQEYPKVVMWSLYVK